MWKFKTKRIENLEKGCRWRIVDRRSAFIW